jgi:hypothetical protein
MTNNQSFDTELFRVCATGLSKIFAEEPREEWEETERRIAQVQRDAALYLEDVRLHGSLSKHQFAHHRYIG